jgi:nucleoside-diphosphate-sugar epimerase
MENLFNKKILITGGEGFIGRHLTKYLLELGAHPTLCSRHARPRSDSVDVLQIDLATVDDKGNIFHHYEFDAVVHLASSGALQKRYSAITAEVAMVANLFDLLLATSCQKFIFLGSADQYGTSAAPQSEQTPSSPVNMYGLGKSMIDVMIDYALRTTPASIITLRPFSVYGPGQPKHMFISQLLQSCHTGEAFRMSQGDQLRDFVYVEDVCQAIICALTSDLKKGIYNIGTGVGTRLWDLVQLVLKLTNSDVSIHRGFYKRSGDPPELVADLTQTVRDLGWKPTTLLEQGLRKTIDAFTRNNS